MHRITQFLSLLRSVVLRRHVEREMDQEWAFHLDARVDELVAGGMSPAAAAQQARREFGDPRRWKEQGRDVRGLGFFDALRQDAAYAVRQLRRAPGFTAVAVATLALGGMAAFLWRRITCAGGEPHAR